MNNHAIECIANTHAACLGIMDDGSSLGRISVFVKVGMADACTGFYYRYSSILPYKVNQGATAARNDQIYVSGSVQQFPGCFTVGR